MTLLQIGEKTSLSGILFSGFVILFLNLSFIDAISANLMLIGAVPSTYPVLTGNSSSSTLPYFPKIYSGSGVDHMNINLVSLKLTGLAPGDEVGVFDGTYCVGSKVIDENIWEENSMSIPSSANELTPGNPNGFTEGNKITLKVYRAGTVYLLYFQTVNNSDDIFEKGGSMFALVDVSRSTGQNIFDTTEEIKMYPNPFSDFLKIEITLTQKHQFLVSIFDINGKLIRTLYKGNTNGKLLVGWDGKDNNQQEVPAGVYFCRVNQTISGVIFQGLGK
jgi:hypothetical protein